MLAGRVGALWNSRVAIVKGRTATPRYTADNAARGTVGRAAHQEPASA